MGLSLIKFVAYDEEYDGFPFTRSKKAKADAVEKPQRVVEDEPKIEEARPAPSRKSRKKSLDPSDAVPAENVELTARRRSARHSGEHEKVDLPALPPVKKRRKAHNSGEMEGNQAAEKPQETETDPAPQEAQQEHTQPIEVTFDATKISLPFADTPIIRRNKEMRNRVTNGSRRSSLGMRGRRASSLIDTGKSGSIYTRLVSDTSLLT